MASEAEASGPAGASGANASGPAPIPAAGPSVEATVTPASAPPPPRKFAAGTGVPGQAPILEPQGCGPRPTASPGLAAGETGKLREGPASEECDPVPDDRWEESPVDTAATMLNPPPPGDLASAEVQGVVAASSPLRTDAATFKAAPSSKEVRSSAAERIVPPPTMAAVGDPPAPQPNAGVAEAPVTAAAQVPPSTAATDMGSADPPSPPSKTAPENSFPTMSAIAAPKLPAGSAPNPLSHAPVPFGSPRFAEEVGLAIARRIHAGEGEGASELLLRIEPANLGRIQVQLLFDSRGGLQAVLSADQPQVLEQLRLGGAELHRALADAGAAVEVAPPRFDGPADPKAGPGHPGSGGGGSDLSGQGQGQGHGQGHAPSHRQPDRSRGSFMAADLSDVVPAFARLGIAGGRIDLIA